MRGIVILLVVLCLAVGVAPQVFAKDMGDKLIRGAANVVTGFPAEIIKNIDEEWTASNNAAIGIFTGFFKGTVLGVCRVSSGVWDVLTFPINLPKDYEPIKKPDYILKIKTEK